MRTRFTILVAFVLVVGMVVTGPVSGADHGPRSQPPELPRLNLLAGTFELPGGTIIGDDEPLEFPAGEPFVVYHGWLASHDDVGGGFGSEWDMLIQMFLEDGTRILSSPDYTLRTGKEICPGNNPDQCYSFVHEFPDGLPEGVHTFQGWWYAACELWIANGDVDECDDPRQLFSPGPLVDGLEVDFVGNPLVLPTWDLRDGITEEDAAEAGILLADALEVKTGVDFDVFLAASFREMYDLMCAMPETAIGVGLNNLIYSFASEDCGVDASFKAIRFGYDTYWTEFLIPRDSGITDLSGLDGMKWAYPDPASISGYSVAVALMAEAGVTPAEDSFAAGGHAAAVLAVYNGEADFGTAFYSPYIDINWNVGWDFDPADADIPDAYVSDCHIVTAAEADRAFVEGDLVCGEYEVRDARRNVRAEAPDVVQEVEILTLSPGIPNDAVAFGAEFPTDLRTQVEEALVEFEWEPSFHDVYWWQGINPAVDSDWAWIRGALATAGFGVDDW